MVFSFFFAAWTSAPRPAHNAATASASNLLDGGFARLIAAAPARERKYRRPAPLNPQAAGKEQCQPAPRLHRALRAPAAARRPWTKADPARARPRRPLPLPRRKTRTFAAAAAARRRDRRWKPARSELAPGR